MTIQLWIILLKVTHISLIFLCCLVMWEKKGMFYSFWSTFWKVILVHSFIQPWTTKSYAYDCLWYFFHCLKFRPIKTYCLMGSCTFVFLFLIFLFWVVIYFLNGFNDYRIWIFWFFKIFYFLTFYKF